ncbi:MAG: outer membrane beta-barrel protein [Gallionella sp.]
MKRELKKILSVVLWGMLASSCVALANGDYYVALNVSKADLIDGCKGASAGCEKTSSIARVSGGYKFSPTWGVEASYGSLGKITIPARGEAKASGWELAIVNTLPIKGSLASMIKLGILQAKFDNGFINRSATSTKLSLAFGLQYDLNKDFSIRGLYEDYSFIGDAVTGQTYVRLWTGGVVYYF